MKKDEDRILVLANQVGYEVMLPAVVMKTLSDKDVGDEVTLFIYYQQSERQPKPVLIGFNNDLEREFFQYFITAEDIGPLKAVKALTVSIGEIAAAIEAKDVGKLKNLKGIGPRTAQKIIATLNGKMGRFVDDARPPANDDLPEADFIRPVLDVLVSQLGHKPADAKKMIGEALKRNHDIRTPEELFDEVYGGSKNR